MPGSEMNARLDARPAQPRAVGVAVPGSGFRENLPPVVGNSYVKFEPRGPVLGPAGLLPGPNASYWARAGLNRSSLMLKGYTYLLPDLMPGPKMNAGIDSGQPWGSYPSILNTHIYPYILNSSI